MTDLWIVFTLPVGGNVFARILQAFFLGECAVKPLLGGDIWLQTIQYGLVIYHYTSSLCFLVHCSSWKFLYIEYVMCRSFDLS